MRLTALLLIVLQALAPATAWSQGTQRSTAPQSPGGSPTAPPAPARAAGPDRRLALVIGNNNYKSAPLVNPINDARLVTETLKGLGFEVILRENLNLRDFKAVMRQFVSRMENEDGTALLFYAGHGVQIDGRNYLLPVDVGIGDEYEVRDESLDLEETLMSRLSRSRKRERIIVLDACRDNPFKAAKQKANRGVGPRGFAQMGSDEKGTLIIYSTSPGHTAEDGQGKNSLFTQHFATEIQKEGIEVGQALRSVFNQVNTQTQGRQTPWYNSSLLGDFYFKAPNVRAEEERRKREIQDRVDAALRDQKRDESARIQAVLAEREKEREKDRVDRERQYNAQIAEMKTMLERRDKDLEQARLQMASSARTRDEQMAILASAEAERRRLERERPNVAALAAPATPPPPTREQEEARKKAEGEFAAKKVREQQVREERDRFLKMEAERRTADERTQREEAEREAKAAAELARREAAARNKQEKERLAQEQAKRKAAEQARREESARVAKVAAEKLRVFEEQAKTATQERQAAETVSQATQAAQVKQPTVAQADEPILRVNERVKQAKEDAERASREADSQERLAKIEESVRRKAALELEMLGRKANMPFEIAALMTNEPQKVVVPGSNGDFFVRGVRLPADVAIRPAPRNAPSRCIDFLGAWGGGRWNGERTAEIWVESIDDDCRVRAIYARGGLGMSGEQATYLRGEGTVRGATLSLDFGSARIELSKDGNAMAGRWSSGVNSATARFSKMPPEPDRSVALFAAEAADFGVAPSRVISTSQVSDRAMLALPTMVPSVDTLTTVQLDAFIKSHPNAVLVDAIVAATHKTVPGAYWMPELGQVTLGQFELNKIEGTMREATGGDRSRPVIVFERSSTFGWFGYHGVLRLLGMGYSNIYWYRGGIDAWHDAQFPLAQAQSWSQAR